MGFLSRLTLLPRVGEQGEPPRVFTQDTFTSGRGGQESKALWLLPIGRLHCVADLGLEGKVDRGMEISQSPQVCLIFIHH